MDGIDTVAGGEGFCFFYVKEKQICSKDRSVAVRWDLQASGAYAGCLCQRLIENK